MIEERYHVYIIWDPIKNEPFYIGWTDKKRKGTSRTREEDHLLEAKRYNNGMSIDSSANLHKINKINKIFDNGYEPEFRIVFESNNISKIKAKETFFIKKYGRADLGLGPLTNMTDGGEGVVNQSIETRKKKSKARKGKPSPHKGKKWGPYSRERRENISESLKGRQLTPKQKEKLKGRIPWNKGLTKETDERVATYATKGGISRKGRPSWCKGLTKETDERVAKAAEKVSKSTKGRIPWNKGKHSPNKGKTYEELYGIEKANELKELRRKNKQKHWGEIKNNNE